MPNCVSFRTVSSTSDVMAPANGRPLMEAACNRTQMMPDAAEMARQIQAMRRVCRLTMMAAGAAELEASAATTARKTKVPVVTAVAANCNPRTTTRGPSISAPNQSIGLPAALLADLERKIAVRRMRVRGKHVPRDMIRSGPPGAYRYRHLIAADPGFA